MRLSTGVWLVSALVTAAACYALTYEACIMLYRFWTDLFVDVSVSFASLLGAMIPIILVWVFSALASSTARHMEEKA